MLDIWKKRIKRYVPGLVKVYHFLKLSPYQLEHRRFLDCLAKEQPYFGCYLHAEQGNSRRHLYMDALVANEWETISTEKKRCHILEIGSWAGGSAITWGMALKKYCNSSGFVLCVDPWIPYHDSSMLKGEPDSVYNIMDRAIRHGEIIKLFLHNIRCSGLEQTVFHIRGQSNEILPVLMNNFFDIVFIDGAHDYQSVLQDLNNAARVLRQGSVLCGDDLELQVPEIDIEAGTGNLNLDFVEDPKTGRCFHPGVTFAVHKYFQKTVSSWEGFWAMRKTVDGWEPIDSSSWHVSQELPVHLQKT